MTSILIKTSTTTTKCSESDRIFLRKHATTTKCSESDRIFLRKHAIAETFPSRANSWWTSKTNMASELALCTYFALEQTKRTVVRMVADWAE